MENGIEEERCMWVVCWRDKMKYILHILSIEIDKQRSIELVTNAIYPIQ